MRVGIIGATGILGREIVAALSSDGELREEILGQDPPLLVSTGNSAGETFQWAEDEELAVEAWSADVVRGLEAAIVAVPAAAAPPILTRLRELGIVALDCSRTSREGAPLYFEESPRPGRVNGVPLLALPTAESLALARLIVPLLPRKPKAVRATILRAASGAGQAGINDVAEATGRLLNGQEPETPLLTHRLAFNVVPQTGPFVGVDTETELDLSRDLTKLLGESLTVSATIGWGPWFFGDFLSLEVLFESPVSTADARELLAGQAHLKVLDDPASAIYPMPSLATGDDALQVGRLRPDPIDPKALRLVAAMDGARAAAGHAVSALRAVARARIAH